MNVYQSFLKQCLRTREVLFSTLLVLILGWLSIAVGRQQLDRKHTEIAEIDRYQKEHFARQVALHNDDLGLLLYYTKFAFFHRFQPLGGIAIGQSDISPAIKRLSIKTFEGQRFDTDLINPNNLHAGNLDLTFVVLFLFPLLIIVLTFNLVAEEIESGTWPLVMVQAKSPIRFVLTKLSVRMSVVFVLLLLLLLTAKILLQIPFDAAFVTVALLYLLYLLFWFALCFFVICFKKPSRANALILLSGWLTLLILLPAAVNAYISHQYPVPEAMRTAIAQRDGYHVKWDTDKKETIEKFYKHYPQFTAYGYPTEGFNWLWYYAMQQMGDDDSATQQRALNEKIMRREKFSAQISSFLPNLHVQLSVNALAGTSLQHHLDYLTHAKAYHEELRLFFYPKIFDGVQADTIDWATLKPTFYAADPQTEPLKKCLPLVFLLALIGIATVPVAKQL